MQAQCIAHLDIGELLKRENVETIKRKRPAPIAGRL